MAASGPRSLALVFLGSLLVGAVSFAAVYRVRTRRRANERKQISESEFVEIMRILAKRIFLQLFSFAQVSARIVAKLQDNDFKAIRFDNPAVRDLLAFSQASVLEQFHLETKDLEHAQKLYYGKNNSELDAIVDSIPSMFDQFAEGYFPVLPSAVVPESSHAEAGEVLETISAILLAKAQENPDQVDEDRIIAESGHSSTIAFYNEVSKRLQNDPEFRNGLVQILMKNQTIVRSKLDQ